MLGTIGAKDIEDLFKTIPDDLKAKTPLRLGEGLSEQELVKHLTDLSRKNINTDEVISFLGGGAYRHFVPSAVTELAGRSEFVTPYTPYQPEICQGTLQAIFEYQTMMCELFGMDISNASNYDCATSVTEAILLAKRFGKNRNAVCLPDNIHPEYIECVKTVLGRDNPDIHIIPSERGIFSRSALKSLLNEKLAAVVVQFPNFFGIIEDFKDVTDLTHQAGALLICATPEPIALGMLQPPGQWGADIAVGEGGSLGMPLNFGGPTLGIFTAKEKFLRNMPGRICGETVDKGGRRGYVLTISTREQHIRREKATSNICSNQALCATTAAIYLSLLGKSGLQKLSKINFDKAEYAKKVLTKISGVKLKFSSPTFNEFTIELPLSSGNVIGRLAKEKIFAGIDLGRWYKQYSNCMLICVTEMNTKDEIDTLAKVINEIL